VTGTHGKRHVRGRVKVHRISVGKPQGKRPLGRLRRRREDNITMDLTQVGWVTWIGSILFSVQTGGGLL
jgi:hypothetical protein